MSRILVSHSSEDSKKNWVYQIVYAYLVHYPEPHSIQFYLTPIMSQKYNHRDSSRDNDRSRTPGTERIHDNSFVDPIPEMSTLDQYHIIEKLGQGTFGVVQKARNKRTGALVAIKQLLNHLAKEGFPITAMREITILKQLDHRNILNIEDIIFGEPDVTNPTDVVTQRGSFYTVSPYMTSDLVGILENPDVKLELNEIKCIMMQLLQGTQYIHEQNFLHRDIKAANILIDNTGVLKIADFGLARMYHGDVPRLGMGPGGGKKDYTALVVTRWYRPPELLLGERKYTTAVDIWGIGCVFAELFIRKPILVGKSDAHQAQLIFELIGSPETWDGAAKLPNKTHFNIGLGRKRSLEGKFESLMPPSAVRLLSGLLTLDPYKRLNALDALNQEFFKIEPLPLRPEEMPQFGECHEIDKERFKKLRENNHLAFRSGAQTYLEDKRFEHEKEKPTVGRVVDRDNYDDYERSYVRRNVSRQAAHLNDNAFEDREQHQRNNQVRRYYNNRGGRTQDSWRQNGYIDNEFENDKVPYRGIDYGGPRTFESKQMYPYIPRLELNDSHYSRHNSPRPLSRTENRLHNPVQSHKNNEGVSYSERRSPTRSHDKSGNLLPREVSHGPERASLGQENLRNTLNMYLNDKIENTYDNLSAAGSSPKFSPGDASLALDIDYHNNDDNEIEEEKEQPVASANTLRNSVNSESKGKCSYSPSPMERINPSEKSDERTSLRKKSEEGTLSQERADTSKTKSRQKDFIKNFSVDAGKEPKNAERDAVLKDAAENATKNTIKAPESRELQQVIGGRMNGAHVIEKETTNEESKKVSNKDKASNADNDKNNAYEPITAKATSDATTGVHILDLPSQEFTTEPKISNIADVKSSSKNGAEPMETPKREGIVDKIRNRTMPYVHGGISDRVANAKSSSNLSASPVLKEIKRRTSLVQEDDSQLEKGTPKPETSSQVKDADVGKSKLLQAHGSGTKIRDSKTFLKSTIGPSKEPVKKDLFGKPKTNSVPITVTRSQLSKFHKKTTNFSKENSFKRGLVGYAMGASKRVKRNYNYMDDCVLESDLSEVEEFPEKGRKHELYENFLNEVGYRREPIYRKHMNEARGFRL